MKKNLEFKEEFKIEEILNDLSKKRRLFHCEADFQFALAEEIKEFYKRKNDKIDVRLEYYFDDNILNNENKNNSSCNEKENNKRNYIDILVIKKDKEEDKVKCIPIELKYKTREEKITLYYRISENIKIEENYNLKEQSAHNDNRFYIYQDIERIQNLVIVDKNKKKETNSLNNMEIVKGYVVFLTNEASYGYNYKDINIEKGMVTDQYFNLGIEPKKIPELSSEEKNELKNKYKRKSKSYIDFYKFNKCLANNNGNIEIKKKYKNKDIVRIYKNDDKNKIKIKNCKGQWQIYSNYDIKNEKDPKKYVYQLVFEIKNEEQ